MRELGSPEAYVRAKHANSGVSLNLLWALESALTGEPWQQVAKLHRERLLRAVEGRDRAALQDLAGGFSCGEDDAKILRESED
ncbi:MAG: TfoX/Sxy family DNA transformation protein [Pirellula sp.]|jgi:hypothetical protein